MAPPRRYSAEDIEQALRTSGSLREACKKLGMAYSAFWRRTMGDKKVRPIAQECAKRGSELRLSNLARPRKRA